MDNSSIKELYSVSFEENKIPFIWLGYSAIILRLNNLTLLFDISDFLDDTQIDELKEPLILLYTHIHDDHFHLRTTLKIAETKDTIIITCSEVYKELEEFLPGTVLKRLQPKKGIKIGDIKIFALEGIHDSEHFIYYIAYDDIRLLHLGSSGYVPLSKLKADIIFVPVGQPSTTATPETALKITKDLKPKYAVVFHGNKEEIEKYRDLIKAENISSNIIVPGKNKLVELVL